MKVRSVNEDGDASPIAAVHTSRCCKTRAALIYANEGYLSMTRLDLSAGPQ